MAKSIPIFNTANFTPLDPNYISGSDGNPIVQGYFNPLEPRADQVPVIEVNTGVIPYSAQIRTFHYEFEPSRGNGYYTVASIPLPTTEDNKQFPIKGLSATYVYSGIGTATSQASIFSHNTYFATLAATTNILSGTGFATFSNVDQYLAPNFGGTPIQNQNKGEIILNSSVGEPNTYLEYLNLSAGSTTERYGGFVTANVVVQYWQSVLYTAGVSSVNDGVSTSYNIFDAQAIDGVLDISFWFAPLAEPSAEDRGILRGYLEFF